ncbi:four-carbon acid sugar kinase family protein [Terriglobus sp. 2YAB30_2]|uniref:four-carbon acid sugar kinase family protein n=1 Tax=Terriglobus sp. 2YAB30_2 TaxID=3233023 RepID=UPI003F97BC99
MSARATEMIGESPEALVILADDLTGAADAAVAFTRTCSDVRVDMNGLAPIPGAVVAWSSDTRDMEPSQLKERIQSVLHDLPSSTILFKKVDSVFRGNTFAEIREVLSTRDYDLAVLAPAYPQMGRRVGKGILQIDDLTGSRSLDLAQELPEISLLPAGLPEDQIVANFRALLDQGQRALLCDAHTQEHLEAVARAAQSLRIRVLWIGSGGLAHALAAASSAIAPPPPVQQKPAGIACYFIGSDHPVTVRQTVRLESSCEPVSFLLKRVPRAQTSESEIQSALAESGKHSIGALVMTGGDTARLVCRALGISAIRLLREFVPGVPLGVAIGGAYDGTPLLLKSGGFGADNLLCDIQAEFSNQETYF